MKVELQGEDHDEVIEDDEAFVTYTILVTNAALINRLGGRVTIPRTEWEDARKFGIRTEMNEDSMTVQIVNNSQESTDVH